MKSSLVAAVLLAVFGCTFAATFYPVIYKNLGCWKDKASRAIPTKEGNPILDGPYATRQSAIHKCARVAYIFGFDVFAVQNGGWCATSSTARSTYRKYGASNACLSHGKGGPWANQVYELKSVGKVSTKSLGCWKDTGNRAIPTLEKLDKNLNGLYHTRSDALKKCVMAAFDRGYKVIALQNGGWCAGARNAQDTYKKYGASTACLPAGKGGPWANQVYELDEKHNLSTLSRLACFR